MVDEVCVIPCRYTINQKETLKNIKEKRSPSCDDSITLWEVYIPPPFPTLQDFGAFNKHNFWVNAFRKLTFQSLKSAKGSAITSPRPCFTCKAADHSYLMCLIHEHPAWQCQHPEYTEEDSDQDSSTDHPQTHAQRGNHPYRPPRCGRGQSSRP